MEKITVSTTVRADIERVWNCWTQSEHVMKWNFASDDWECPRAENNLVQGGMFSFTMAAKDGSVSFDFKGTYTNIILHEKIEYGMEDGRTVQILFTPIEDGVEIVETFDAENENPIEMQKDGWQSILNNFTKYVESQN